MSEIIICTPPISTQEIPLFRKSITPLFAGYLAKGLDADLVLGEGTIGNSIDTDPDTSNVENATEMLLEGIAPKFLRDDNPEYKEFTKRVITDLHENGFIQVEERSVMHCGCGVVNLDIEVTRSYPIDKLIHVEDSENGLCCKQCRDELQQSSGNYLVLQSSFFDVSGLEDMVAPSYSKKKSISMVEERKKQDRIVSKLNGDSYPEVEIEGTLYKIDPGLWMLAFPLYIARSTPEAVVTAGASQHGHLLGSVALWSHFRNQDDLRALLHPRVKFMEDISYLSDMTTQQAINEHGAQGLNILIALAAQWSTHESRLRNDDVKLANKHRSKISTPQQTESFIDLQELLKEFNGNRVRAALKKVRQNQNLSGTNDGKLVKLLVGDSHVE